MIRLLGALVGLLLLIVAPGCASGPRALEGSAVRLTAADIDALTGPAWIGTLTYLDYTSKQPTTIDSSLMVRRTGDSPPTWEIGVGYSKEPHANSKETLTLSADGAMLGDERVVSREPLAGGGVKFITESDGEDDRRPARFRFEHTITAHEYSKRKMVRFEGEAEVFERHVYRWTR